MLSIDFFCLQTCGVAAHVYYFANSRALFEVDEDILDIGAYGHKFVFIKGLF